MQRKILELLQPERDRWVLWTPVFFGSGIGAYFALLSEPDANLLFSAAVITFILWVVSLFRKWEIWPVFAIIALFCTGLAVASYRTQTVAAPALSAQIPFAVVEGRIDEIVPREKDTRIVLSDVRFERLDAAETPGRVSLTLRGKEHINAVKQGDLVRVKAGFFPPPQASFPDAYQFNRHYYFQRIGATGYSFGTTPPEVLQSASSDSGLLEGMRQHIFSLFMREMGDEEGSVAAALTMGEQRAIPAHVFDAMRDSGLAHILSISGLHMALAAGIFFFTIRFLLTLVPAVALRFNTKKIAAFCALLGALAYLLLSGMPIPAQRSYLMIALVLLAVGFDRQVTPMRSLALAAMLVLIWSPESILNPSFQLSFAATTALVAYYEHWREREKTAQTAKHSRLRRFLRYWMDIIGSSTVATVATAPFILHHFEGFPIYSVLGNLLSLTLVSFWIMPLIVLVLLLLPFGLESWLILPLKLGVKAMVGIGEWVAGLPQAVVDIPPLSVWWLAICALGGLWLCIWRGNLRWAGAVAIVAPFFSLFLYLPPDVILSEDGKKLAVRAENNEIWMLRGRSEGFQQEQWRRFARVQGFTKVPKGQDTLRCDAQGCLYRFNGYDVSVIYNRDALLEDCAESDLLIVPDWSVHGDSRAECSAGIIDRRWLLREGVTAIWLGDEGMVVRSVRDSAGTRPWSRGGLTSRQ